MSIKTFSQNYAISEIPEELKKDANVVVRNYSSEYVIKSVDNMEVKERKIISILNKAGEKFSYVRIPYDKQSKVSDIKIKILNENGKVIKTYSKSDLNDVSQTNDSFLYSEDRALVMKIIEPVFPYTIDISFTEKTADTAFLPVLQPFYSDNVSVENWSIGFKNESGINLRKKITDTSFGKAEISESGNNLKVAFKSTPAYVSEKYSPNPQTLFPKVEFALDKACLKGNCGDFSSWNNLAKWYKTLINPVSAITPEIQQEVNNLNLTGTTSEKVKKIYQYMQKKTRYVFVGIGIGGWQPMVADEVRKKSYGDCKALTNYMRVLLKAAGIPSYYAKIHMDNTPIFFDENFPKMGGNHVVLYIPTEQGDIWLENTSQNMAFNHLSFSTRNRNVVLIDEIGSQIINTPSYKAEDSEEKIKISAKISEDNSMLSVSKFSYTGAAYDYSLRLETTTPQEFKDIIKQNYPYLTFASVEGKNFVNDRDNAMISYDLDFKVDDFAKSMGNDKYFRATPFVDSEFYLDGLDKRTQPLEIPFGFTDDYRIEYSIPNNYKLAELPASKKFISEFGIYELNFSTIDGKIIVERKFVINKVFLPKENIQPYLNFRKQISRMDATKILITKL
ncbi:hypothetical protein D3C87_1035930 [compost metagenome]